MRWDARAEVLFEGTTRIKFYKDENVMSNAKFITMLKKSEEFCILLSEAIADATSAKGIFYETKPIAERSLDQPMEFVLVDSSSVGSIKANISPFAKQLQNPTANEVRSFLNLGKDACLVSPCQNEGESPETFAHLLNFLRAAPTTQQINLWKLVGIELEKRLKKGNPVWLSTSGLGVYWLHIRICDFSKYYTHTDYKKFQNI